MKKYDFKIRMKVNDMFAFMASQQFTGGRGLVNLLMNLIIILCLVFNWENYDTTAKLLLFMLLFMFDVYTPLTLYGRAKRQVNESDRFSLETCYVVTEEGIKVSQGSESMEFHWGHFQKYKATGKRIYLYTSKITAFIFPKEQVGDEVFGFLISMLKKNKSEFGMLSLDTAKCTTADEGEKNGEAAEE